MITESFWFSFVNESLFQQSTWYEWNMHWYVSYIWGLCKENEPTIILKTVVDVILTHSLFPVIMHSQIAQCARCLAIFPKCLGENCADYYTDTFRRIFPQKIFSSFFTRNDFFCQNNFQRKDEKRTMKTIFDKVVVEILLCRSKFCTN